MPQAVLATQLIATKLPSGNFQLQFQNGLGGVQFIAVVSAADLTAINALSTNATYTQSYPQDKNKGDYPQHYAHSEGN